MTYLNRHLKEYEEIINEWNTLTQKMDSLNYSKKSIFTKQARELELSHDMISTILGLALEKKEEWLISFIEDLYIKSQFDLEISKPYYTWDYYDIDININSLKEKGQNWYKKIDSELQKKQDEYDLYVAEIESAATSADIDYRLNANAPDNPNNWFDD